MRAGVGQRRHERLRRREDFSAVHRRGRSWANALLVFRVRRTGGPGNRFGFSVSKRVGNAVVRNRVRRRLREIMSSLPLQQGYDVVVIARPDAAAARWVDLQAAARDVARRSGLLMEDVDGEGWR